MGWSTYKKLSESSYKYLIPKDLRRKSIYFIVEKPINSKVSTVSPNARKEIMYGQTLEREVAVERKVEALWSIPICSVKSSVQTFFTTICIRSLTIRKLEARLDVHLTICIIGFSEVCFCSEN